MRAPRRSIILLLSTLVANQTLKVLKSRLPRMHLECPNQDRLRKWLCPCHFKFRGGFGCSPLARLVLTGVFLIPVHPFPGFAPWPSVSLEHCATNTCWVGLDGCMGGLHEPHSFHFVSGPLPSIASLTLLVMVQSIQTNFGRPRLSGSPCQHKSMRC